MLKPKCSLGVGMGPGGWALAVVSRKAAAIAATRYFILMCSRFPIKIHERGDLGSGFCLIFPTTIIISHAFCNQNFCRSPPGIGCRECTRAGHHEIYHL